MSAFHDNALMGASGQQGYTISRSVRLRSSATGNLSRTFGTPTSNTTWTFSLWLKRGILSQASDVSLLVGSDYTGIYFKGAGSDAITFYKPTAYVFTSTSVYRDPSAWYHIVVSSNGTTVTAYVNGVSAGSYTGTLPNLNSAVAHKIGVDSGSVSKFDGYMTEINFIDGQALTPSSFGETDTTTGVWKPKKYTGTYGTNGFYLNFSDNSSNTATTIGKDYSGNGNNWTPNNISVTAGVTYDSMVDSPTVGATSSNYAVLNPLRQNGSATFAQGNLAGTSESGTSRGLCGTIVLPRSDKWYMEWTPSSSTTNWFGVTANDILATDINTAGQQSVLYYANGTKWVNGSNSAYGSSYTTQTIGIAFDGPAGTITFYRDNVSQGAISLPSSTVDYVFCMGNAGGGGVTNYANFGQRPFSYTPPTGFVALNTQNLPAPTISNGAQYMAATLYTGNGSTQTINNSVNGVSFQPDFVWGKIRSGADYHVLTDAVRGNTKFLKSNTTDAEITQTQNITSFNSNGFTLGTNTDLNRSTYTFVGWQWKAGGTAVSNTAGTITSSVSANPTAGFSVVTYTGTGANATVGHGLGVAPSMVIVKYRSAAGDWKVYHASVGNTFQGFLNDTSAFVGSSPTVWNSTTPTSTVFSIGTNGGVNTSSGTYVAYCFAEVAGYSKFGKYTGNGSADGPFVYLGFRPRFLMIKDTTNAQPWIIIDTSRNPYNQAGDYLQSNSSAAENGGSAVSTATADDILSNGFKLRNNASSSGYTNASGATYIFMAVAENPFKNSLAR